METDVQPLILQELLFLRKEIFDLKEIVLKQNESAESNQSASSEQPVAGIDEKISLLLHELKIPANIKGYSMLRESVKMVYLDDLALSYGITKYLYPSIAKKYSSTPVRAERAIRHAIEVSWSKGKSSFYPLNHIDNKPTNSQLIALLADKLKLEEAKIS